MSKTALLGIIAIVLIGLIFSGMLLAQNMIEGIQSKRFIKQFETYDTVVTMFSQKIGGLPGDTTSATSNWGQISGDCYSDNSDAAKTCNGNGNGQVDYEDVRKFGYEPWRFWRHLSLSGLISETYSGTMKANCATGNCFDYEPETNAPVASTNYNHVIAVFYIGKKESEWAGKKEYRHVYSLGSVNSKANPQNSGRWWGEAFTAAEAKAFDEKFDDGAPNKGKITAVAGEKSPDCIVAPKKEGLFAKVVEDAKYNIENPELTCVLLIDTRFQ